MPVMFVVGATDNDPAPAVRCDGLKLTELSCKIVFTPFLQDLYLPAGLPRCLQSVEVNH